MDRLKSLVVIILIGSSVAVRSQSPNPVSPEIDQRVNALIAKMSLDDKLKLIGGVDGFYTQAIPSLGLKRLKMSDGPVGVRTYGPAPAYTAGVALAASWDPDLARRVGVSLGQDARARGVNFLLAPGVNIYRSPLNGRNMEYFGEDPYLASRIAVGYINGVQSQGVSATVKHFAANNSEYDRHRINSIIDERTLRELYLPAFEAAVREAHVGAVMDSYNLVNGEHSTQNGHLNIDILRHDWGFQGVVMSDWTATYDGIAAANNGLDLEMPFAKLMTPETLKAGLASGKLKEAVLDEKCRHILRTAAQFGWLDRDQTISSIPLNNPAASKVALDEALESITLLKNDGGLLPLDPKKVKTIAVIGPESVVAVVGGGGSSQTTPFKADSFLAGLMTVAGDRMKVMYAPGLPSLATIFGRTSFRNLTVGVTGPGAPPRTENPERALSRINTYVGNGDGSGPSRGAGLATYRYKGEYVPSAEGPHLLIASAPSQDTYRVLVDGKEVLVQSRDSAHSVARNAAMELVENKPVSIEVVYETNGSTPRLGVGVVSSADMFPAESQKIVREADAVLVTVGFDPSTESEGFDRTYEMPWPQDELIQRVAAVNPKTIVAITAGGSVETASWIAKVPALLHNWYPGQEGSTALAQILLGDRSPEGHLPFSWERTLDQDPASAHYAEEPGDGHIVHYAEGMFLGYRFYTSKNEEPLFPFGFGMSYSKFAFSNLSVKKRSADDVDVSFDVQNTGGRVAADVAQVYVGDPSAKVKRPLMELKQFSKVRLNPGEKRHVVLSLNKRAFSYYDTEAKDWRVDPGNFEVYVGDSSDSIALKQELQM
jgi:beta-glucosidase